MEMYGSAASRHIIILIYYNRRKLVEILHCTFSVMAWSSGQGQSPLRQGDVRVEEVRLLRTLSVCRTTRRSPRSRIRCCCRCLREVSCSQGRQLPAGEEHGFHRCVDEEEVVRHSCLWRWAAEVCRWCEEAVGVAVVRFWSNVVASDRR